MKALAAASVLAAFVVAAAACSESTFEAGGLLRLDLSVESPVPLGDSVVVEFDITGSQLLGLVLDFGDGGVDSVFLSGAQFAGGRSTHRYDAVGEYLITGRVQDALAGDTMDVVSVVVTP